MSGRIRRVLAVSVAAAVVVVPNSLPTGAVTMAKTGATSLHKPAVRWKAIPFGQRRRRQMGAYSKRHYGRWAWRLTDPHVVVEHYTGGNSFSSAWNTFASNSRDLGELPGTCAHFIIDRDGAIYQLAPLGTRCRHTVGLNYTAIGIEHVGTSDGQILRDRRQIRASYRLTLWLMSRFHIQLRNVIGHNESLMSPYHHERYQSWRCQTHSDWTHADMRVYRRHLKRRALAAGVPIGPAAAWVDPRC